MSDLTQSIAYVTFAGSRRIAALAVCAAMSLVLLSCARIPRTQIALHKATTFHATFDARVDADFALGDPVLYHIPDWNKRDELTPGLPPEVSHVAGGGRVGDGLEFSIGRKPVVVLFKADRNVAYDQSDWSGTVSFWMSLDPDRDLAPGFSDPLQITSKSWNDAALFVDFTRDDAPRHFRFAAFADRDVWDPTTREWEEVPVEERPMIDIPNPPFSRDVWTHVVMTFDNFNTGRRDGVLTAYLNGEKVGELSGREQTFTWDTSEAVIAIGINYVGKFDELRIFDRALAPNEVKELYQPKGSVVEFSVFERR